MDGLMHDIGLIALIALGCYVAGAALDRLKTIADALTAIHREMVEMRLKGSDQ